MAQADARLVVEERVDSLYRELVNRDEDVAAADAEVRAARAQAEGIEEVINE